MSEKLFKLPGLLTFDTVKSVQECLLMYLQEEKTTSLRLDLTEVIQCDSAGLALLIEAKRLCCQYKKCFVLAELPKSVEALGKLCGVDVLFLVDSVVE